MSISNWLGTADTFTWPHNPRTYDDAITSNQTITEIAYSTHHIAVSGGGIRPRSIVMNGFFDGTNKNTNYQDLSKHFSQNTRLKKLYWDTDKFSLGLGLDCKKTHSGGRTNFIDYVATFRAVLGILLNDTEKTSGTNAGNVSTYVTELRGTYDGSGDVTMTDNDGNSLKIPAAAFAGTEKVLYLLVKMIDAGSGIGVTEWAWTGLEVDSGTTSSTTAFKLVESGQNFTSTVNAGDIVHNTTDDNFTTVTAVDSDTTLSLQDDTMASGETYVIYHREVTKQTTGGSGILRIGAGVNVSTITTANLTSVTTIFRDGHSA